MFRSSIVVLQYRDIIYFQALRVSMEEQRQRQEEETRRNQTGTPQVRERPPTIEEGILLYFC